MQVWPFSAAGFLRSGLLTLRLFENDVRSPVHVWYARIQLSNDQLDHYKLLSSYEASQDRVRVAATIFQGWGLRASITESTLSVYAYLTVIYPSDIF